MIVCLNTSDVDLLDLDLSGTRVGCSNSLVPVRKTPTPTFHGLHGHERTNRGVHRRDVSGNRGGVDK